MQRLILIIIIIMCICIALLFKRVSIAGGGSNGSQSKKIFPNIKVTDNLKRNCDQELVYATNDEQCARMCLNKTDYLVINGVCRDSKILLSSSDGTSANTCDPKRGFLSYIVGNGMLGNATLLCLSVDPGIQADDARLANRFCKDGTFKPDQQLDYLKRLPLSSDCMCGMSDELIIIPATSYIRPYGICVNKTITKLF